MFWHNTSCFWWFVTLTSPSFFAGPGFQDQPLPCCGSARLPLFGRRGRRARHGAQLVMPPKSADLPKIQAPKPILSQSWKENPQFSRICLMILMVKTMVSGKASIDPWVRVIGDSATCFFFFFGGGEPTTSDHGFWKNPMKAWITKWAAPPRIGMLSTWNVDPQMTMIHSMTWTHRAAKMREAAEVLGWLKNPRMPCRSLNTENWWASNSLSQSNMCIMWFISG